MAYISVSGERYDSRLAWISPNAPKGTGSYAVCTGHNMAELGDTMKAICAWKDAKRYIHIIAPYVLESILILETGGFND
jgi:hypothetical protein